MNIDKKTREMIAESWSVSWPMAIVMLFEFIIGITDVYIAGKFGSEAQAAYGVAFQLYFIFIILGIGLSVGSVSVVARLFTSGNKEEFESSVSSTIFIAAAAGCLFGLCGMIFSPAIVHILKIPESIKGITSTFIRIYSAGFFFDYILIATNGILRSCKLIQKSLKAMAIVCALNVALNFILALGTPMGFNGIAAATVISLFAGCIISIVYTRRLITKTFSLSLGVIKKILDISWPSAILQVLWQFGTMVLYMILAALPRDNIEVMAAFTNGLKVESAIFLPAFAFNMANAVVVGNLLGQKKDEDALRNGLVTAVIGVGVVTVLTVLVMINASRIAHMLSSDPQVVAESMKYIYIALLSEPLMAWGVILGGAINGAGDTKSVMFISGVSLWLIRLPLCYFLGVHLALGTVAIWWSMNASILIQSVMMTVRYFGRGWMRRE